MAEQVKPYNSSSKKKQISLMFDNISKTYDAINFIMSFGMDYYWRLKIANKINNNSAEILDVATGTADLAILMSKKTTGKVIGVDISDLMLDIGRKKVIKKDISNIELINADGESLPFKNCAFDLVTSSFGIRNFENIKRGLKEFNRVLKSGGELIILEPSIPKNLIFKQFYLFYFNIILPIIGYFISRDKRAYQYFTKSVNAFPNDKKFIKMLNETGFRQCKVKKMTMGIISIFIAKK